MKLKEKLKGYGFALLEVFFPRRCVTCNALLNDWEEGMCLRCNMDLPRTNYHLHRENELEEMLADRLDLVHATSYFFYSRGGKYSKLLHELKYEDRSDLGPILGRMMASEIKASSNFFDGIDVIVPVPLHKRKQLQRGYNQSTQLAKGVSQVTGIPIEEKAVKRIRQTESQTKKSARERLTNLDEAFSLENEDALHGKHVLIIDDVLTTGATTIACAKAAMQAGDVRISILTLAKAG